MKFIVNNNYIKSYCFESYRDFSQFIEGQDIKKLKLEESHGNKYYCYLGHDSLSQKKLFAICFESDKKESDLNLLVWNSKKLLVLDSGMNLFFVDDNLNVKFVLEMLTPLIGLHITKGDNLLVLEEDSARLISAEGDILKSESFDFIDDFSIENNLLYLQVNGEKKTFDLE
jgi:hypothetical protein